MEMRFAIRRPALPVACADDCCSAKASELEGAAQIPAQRRILIAVFAINLVMFGVELLGGILAGSSALVADSVDMLGDASVYALTLFALERSIRWKAGAALVKSGIVLAFGAWIGFGIVRGIGGATAPEPGLMQLFGFAALAANLVCLALLWRFRNSGINMSSTFECSRNDVLANTSVIAAAVAVAVTGSPWPDLLAAAIIALVFMRSSVGIGRRALPLWLDREIGQT